MKNRKWQRAICFLGLVSILCIAGICLRFGDTLETGSHGKQHTIVIDCGHGGIDPGKVGIDGSYEKDVNLSIGLLLRDILEQKHCKVIMTRDSDTGLYQEGDANKKVADLRRRVEVMNQEDVDVVLSIHQNSFTGESSRGAQVFFYSGSEKGEELAKILQDALIQSVDQENHRQAKANSDYYVLRNTRNTTVIAECGFLSNAEEAKKLQEKTYQRQIAWAIAQGTIAFLEKQAES